MPSKVYFGSAKQKKWDANETLPIKLDLVLERLEIRNRVKDESVCIKMHLGGHVGYSTVHPVFVRRVVQAVKDGGGNPFVCDTPGSVLSAHTRGYTQETVGCPIISVSGPEEKHFYTFKKEYKGLSEWKMAGVIHDATFLIDLAHAKGHPTCGFGGVFKNLALGGFVGETRSKLHDTMQYDRYWFAEKCPDDATRKKIMESCPMEALVEDKQNPKELHMHMELCNQCGVCLKVAPPRSLKIDPINFRSFQEANAIGVSMVLSTFAKDKQVFINIAEHMTAVCDCFGFTGMAVLPDLGVFGSNDIVAVEQAILDLIGKQKLIYENVPENMQLQKGAGHPFQELHGPYKNPYIVVEEGEKLGLGTRDYQLIDVMEEKAKQEKVGQYISAAHM